MNKSKHYKEVIRSGLKEADFGYGISVTFPSKPAPLDKNGNPYRDNRMETARIAARILDLLSEEEGGNLKSIHAINALEKAINQIASRQTRICQEAYLPSIFGVDARIESGHRI